MVCNDLRSQFVPHGRSQRRILVQRLVEREHHMPAAAGARQADFPTQPLRRLRRIIGPATHEGHMTVPRHVLALGRHIRLLILKYTFKRPMWHIKPRNRLAAVVHRQPIPI